MFKKYYKEANNDIKADEAFINSVIEKAQKKRVPSQKSYYRYALTAAAAVVVLSATAVTMPLLTDNDSDGVISVVTQTAQPQKDEVLNTPTHSPINTAVPNPPEKVKETTKKVSDKYEKTSEKKDIKIAEKKEEKKNDEPLFSSADKADEKKPEIFNDTAENGMETSDRLMFSAALSSGIDYSQEMITENTADSGADEDTAENKKNQQQPAYKSEPDKMMNNSPVAGVSGGGGGGSAVMSAESRTVLPPQGYYISESGNNRYVFVSDNGAVITVTTQYTNGADTEPVYSGLNVSFTINGTKYNIFSDTAEKTSIDELVNSLR